MAEENFKDRSQCLVDQYNDYEVFGQDVSGKYLYIYIYRNVKTLYLSRRVLYNRGAL